ncbi:class I SAM-dependent methyltransferase [Clostridium oceanicum]|uniref:Class I SAM-dependent methyltransferase n=1 Tax=Clostridium oceanicum TaxID=1543 RepID=A0ABN1JBL3_9CLOT
MNNISDKNQEVNKEAISLNSYEQMAEYYFKDVDTKPYNAYYERPATVSLIPKVKGKKVLDAGCAAGWYTKYLLEKGAAVTALDFSPQMIEMTKKRVGDSAKIIRADLNEPLSFIHDQSMDVVLSSLALHYIENWDGVLGEFNRVLKKEGQIIISVHHPFMDFTVFNRENYFLTELLDDEWDTPSGKVKLQFYRRPLSKIIMSIIDSGFTIEKLLEPMPTEEFKNKLPDAYHRLTKKPQFLFIRARKN